ncbi:TPA: hypothetical protein ACN335_000294 [Vibrio parahaemolyticus]|uniref:hypothetical protein n=1 Tax=Vibrio parahaemolyticus TaxID=670 RepID=UPI001F2E5D7B|nr:hypothetical protein [Vibrio parahaemolyticus]EGV1832190.1 hypothetical protein [Vibrio parahaemolyticus]EHW0649415.1 hypothetical protein [Vibrio parahaemolyticus]MCG0027066.1 hypothetical protein [Vibrio parahaemolyticus]
MVTQNTNFSPEQPKREKDEQQNVAIVEFNSSVLSRQSTDFLTHEELKMLEAVIGIAF